MTTGLRRSRHIGRSGGSTTTAGGSGGYMYSAAMAGVAAKPRKTKTIFIFFSFFIKSLQSRTASTPHRPQKMRVGFLRLLRESLEKPTCAVLLRRSDLTRVAK